MKVLVFVAIAFLAVQYNSAAPADGEVVVAAAPVVVANVTDVSTVSSVSSVPASVSPTVEVVQNPSTPEAKKDNPV